MYAVSRSYGKTDPYNPDVRLDSGQQLRQDDPSALKDIIEIVQKKISTKDEAVRFVDHALANFFLCSDCHSSRTRFMVETLTNLKNNKLKRNATQNQGGASVERMKKFLSGLNKTKHGMNRSLINLLWLNFSANSPLPRAIARIPFRPSFCRDQGEMVDSRRSMGW